MSNSNIDFFSMLLKKKEMEIYLSDLSFFKCKRHLNKLPCCYPKWVFMFFSTNENVHTNNFNRLHNNYFHFWIILLSAGHCG